MRFPALVSICVVALVGATPAAAEPFPRADLMLKLAERTFPTACTPSLRIASAEEADAVGMANGLGSYEGPFEDGGVQGFADLPNCQAVLAPWTVGSGNECAVIVHEVGHLSGLGHSEDPHNIMFPSGAFPYPPCAPFVEYDGAVYMIHALRLEAKRWRAAIHRHSGSKRQEMRDQLSLTQRQLRANLRSRDRARVSLARLAAELT